MKTLAEPTKLHSNYRVKAKKQHEIVRLSAALRQLHCQCAEPPCVLVDVGGGVGHLARQLSSDHSFTRIVTVDAEVCVCNVLCFRLQSFVSFSLH